MSGPSAPLSGSAHVFLGLAFKYPSEEKQKEFLQEIYHGCDVEAEDVEYVECHALGDLVADAQEVNALTVGMETKTGGTPLLIGSLKSNIGHLGAASGTYIEDFRPPDKSA